MILLFLLFQQVSSSPVLYADDSRLLFNLVTPNNWSAEKNTTVTANYESNYYQQDLSLTSYEQQQPVPFEKTPKHLMPYFVESMSTQNITVNPGENALLMCVVRNLGEHLVMWRRADQLVPLTIGQQRHVLDERIMADANALTGEWTLAIRNARLADSAVYLCQVNAITGDDGSYLERRVQLRVRGNLNDSFSLFLFSFLYYLIHLYWLKLLVESWTFLSLAVPLLVIDAKEVLDDDNNGQLVQRLASVTSLSKPVIYDLLTTIRRPDALSFRTTTIHHRNQRLQRKKQPISRKTP